MVKKIIRGMIFNRWSAFIHDVCWVPIVIVVAFWVRFNLNTIPELYRSPLLNMILLAVPVQGMAFWVFGLYRGMWRYASVQDFVRILKAVFLGTLLLTMVSVVLTRLQGLPRSVLLLYPLFLTIFLIGPRILYRWIKEKRFRLHPKTGKRTLIVGAGTTGELLLRDLVHHEEYQPVAFVDDDSQKIGREIHGIRVWGKVDEIAEIISGMEIDLVLIAITAANRRIIHNIVKQAGSAGIECRTIPSAVDLVNHEIDIDQIRPITVEDLLGRDSIELDRTAISGYLRDKSVLVTGGGGSIGSELCRQISQMHPKCLIVFDHGEYNLYAIDFELKEKYPDLEIISVLGDVKNRERVEWVFQTFRPLVVFHAAAYKHVPLVEANPAEGLQNNVSGTKIIADAVDTFSCDRLVLVSTDKAVNPTNVMGATKRIAELYCQNLDSRSDSKFITTRFGNVLGSAGSVVPLFERQIREGGPVTVTHKEIARFFMTIPEAVSLILQAGAMGDGGEIFVLDMGEPVLIHDLAKQMIRLSGFTPGEDIEIVFSGLRPGEKLYEEVFHDNEELQQTNHPKLMLAASRNCDWQWLNNEMEKLRLAAVDRNVGNLVRLIKTIVPEYTGGNFCTEETDKENPDSAATRQA